VWVRVRGKNKLDSGIKEFYFLERVGPEKWNGISGERGLGNGEGRVILDERLGGGGSL
jgi:hypothetical protein